MAKNRWFSPNKNQLMAFVNDSDSTVSTARIRGALKSFYAKRPGISKLMEVAYEDEHCCS